MDRNHPDRIRDRAVADLRMTASGVNAGNGIVDAIPQLQRSRAPYDEPAGAADMQALVCVLLRRSIMMSEMRRATWRGLDGRLVPARERWGERQMPSLSRSQRAASDPAPQSPYAIPVGMKIPPPVQAGARRVPAIDPPVRSSGTRTSDTKS